MIGCLIIVISVISNNIIHCVNMDRGMGLDDPFFSARPMYYSRYFSNPFDSHAIAPRFGSSSLSERRTTRNDRFAEMDKKFDELVGRVDDRNMDDETFARFSGILTRIDSDPFKRTRIPVDLEGKDKATTVAVTPEKFDLSVSVQDFKPEEVSVKVRGDQVMVHAKRENKDEGDGMYAYSFREFKRAFTLPEGVEAEQLTSSLTAGGILKLEAPVKASKSIEAAPKDVNIRVDHGKH